MSIGINIKYVRKVRGLTQNQLAEQAHISRTYLADMEGDRYNPSIDTMTNIAKALDVPLSTLLYEGNIKELFELSTAHVEQNLPASLDAIKEAPEANALKLLLNKIEILSRTQ